jgi:hypothetical protein
MKSHVTFHMWKDFTWNYKWNFTCERSSHEIINNKWNFTCERISHERYKLQVTYISHVKGFHMKLQITSEISHMWKDFTWNYKWNFTCEKISISHDITNYKLKFHMYIRKRISDEIATEISHVKGFARNYKLQWNFTCERISHEITSSGGTMQASEIGGVGIWGANSYLFGGGKI